MTVTIISFVSFAVFSGFLLFTFIRSTLDVREYEVRRYQDFKKKGGWGKIKESTFLFIILGACSLVAAKYADFKLFWLMAGIAFFASAGVSVFAIAIKELARIPHREVPELTAEILEKNIRRRKRIWIFQIPLLAFWVYSWRSLLF